MGLEELLEAAVVGPVAFAGQLNPLLAASVGAVEEELALVELMTSCDVLTVAVGQSAGNLVILRSVHLSLQSHITM